MFTGLKPRLLLLRPTLRAKLFEASVLMEQCVADMLDVMKMQEELKKLHKYMAAPKQESHKYAQRRYNSKTNGLLRILIPVDYVSVRSNDKKGHKLSIEWQGPMRVIESWSELLLEAENLEEIKMMVTHVQRRVQYLVLHLSSLLKKELIELSN